MEENTEMCARERTVYVRLLGCVCVCVKDGEESRGEWGERELQRKAMRFEWGTLWK